MDPTGKNIIMILNQVHTKVKLSFLLENYFALRGGTHGMTMTSNFIYYSSEIDMSNWFTQIE